MQGLVTVIGGGGFVGRYVAQALMRAGARLRVAQRDPREAFFLKTLGGLGQTQFVAADVTRPDTIARAVAGADAVVNLAGTFGATMQRVQADGAATVAQAAAAAGVARLVHLSAIGADAGSPALYARSKAAGEAGVRAAFPTAAILRPAAVFGREDRFVNRFAGMIETASLLPLAPVPILRGGVRFQPVFVGDVADAVVAALAGGGAGRTVELGGPDVLTMAALYRWIAATIGRPAHFLELPDLLGAVLARVPGSPITRDQWLMLQRDTVVAPGADDLASLGIAPTPLAAVAPQWLVRFRRKGRFGERAQTLAPPVA